eukprot:3350860-Rhodomonas_salina.1
MVLRGVGCVWCYPRCSVLAYRMILCDVRYQASVWCYEMCGTELAYAATARLLLESEGLVYRVCPYAMCGTELAYGATRCAAAASLLEMAKEWVFVGRSQ